jgi:hypothetical protein
VWLDIYQIKISTVAGAIKVPYCSRRTLKLAPRKYNLPNRYWGKYDDGLVKHPEKSS